MNKDKLAVPAQTTAAEVLDDEALAPASAGATVAGDYWDRMVAYGRMTPDIANVARYLHNASFRDD